MPTLWRTVDMLSTMFFYTLIAWLILNGFFVVFAGISVQHRASIYIGEMIKEVNSCE